MIIFVENAGHYFDTGKATLLADSGQRAFHDNYGYFGDKREYLYKKEDHYYLVFCDLPRAKPTFLDRLGISGAVTTKSSMRCQEVDKINAMSFLHGHNPDSDIIEVK